MGSVPAKSHSLEISKTNGTLLVRAKGTRTYNSTAAIMVEIMAYCEELDTHRALVDVRKLSGSLGFWQIVKLVTSRFTELRNLRVLSRAALLDCTENSGRYRLLETMARNRGYNLRVFVEEEQAMRWLEGDSSAASDS